MRCSQQAQGGLSASRTVEELTRQLQQIKALLILQRLRVLMPQLDFRTATDRGCADFRSIGARSDDGRPRRERGLHVEFQRVNYS